MWSDADADDDRFSDGAELRLCGLMMMMLMMMVTISVMEQG